jgi:hypothetical protein
MDAGKSSFFNRLRELCRETRRAGSWGTADYYSASTAARAAVSAAVTFSFFRYKFGSHCCLFDLPGPNKKDSKKTPALVQFFAQLRGPTFKQHDVIRLALEGKLKPGKTAFELHNDKIKLFPCDPRTRYAANSLLLVVGCDDEQLERCEDVGLLAKEIDKMAPVQHRFCVVSSIDLISKVRVPTVQRAPEEDELVVSETTTEAELQARWPPQVTNLVAQLQHHGFRPVGSVYCRPQSQRGDVPESDSVADCLMARVVYNIVNALRSAR